MNEIDESSAICQMDEVSQQIADGMRNPAVILLKLEKGCAFVLVFFFN